MRILSIVMLLTLLLVLAPSAIKAETMTPTCPAGYEGGYIWTDCFWQGDGCYGIRDDGMTNSMVLCPRACCEDSYGGQYVKWVKGE